MFIFVHSMRMLYLYLSLGLSFLTALGAASFVGFWFFGVFSRRCTKLEWRVGDLEERSTKVAGRELANKRWAKDAEVEALMAQALHTANPPRKRYDNDP